MEDDIRDARREACDSYFQDHRSSSSSYMSEADKCYYGTSTKSDSYCCSNYGYRCYYVSSSSYMSEADKCYYGTSTKGSTYCCNNYGYQCAYAYSSSSYRYSSSSVKTEVVEAHTSKTKTMKQLPIQPIIYECQMDELGDADQQLLHHLAPKVVSIHAPTRGAT